MPATQNHGLVKGRNASAPITKKCFLIRDTGASDGESVKMAVSATAHALAGVSVFSVSAAEIVQGKGATVVMDGRAVVTVGAADLNEGDVVTSDANGNAIVAATGNFIGGVVDEAGTAGNDCSIVIVCNGSTAA